MDVIDTHPHIIAAPSERYPFVPVGGGQSSWSKDVVVTGDDLAAMMSRAGVEKAAVVQTSTVYGYDNSYLADAVAASTGRFVGVCSVNPLADSAADDLAYWVEQRGLSGVRLFAAGGAVGEIYSLDDPKMDAFWDVARQIGIPVDVQIRYPSVQTVGNALRRHPGLRIVLDHIGGSPITDGPPYAAAADLFALAALEGAHVKFSNHNLDSAETASAEGDLLVALVNAFGAERILWGSNFPNTFGKYPPTLETYTTLVNRVVGAVHTLKSSDQEAVLAGTARIVYPGLSR